VTDLAFQLRLRSRFDHEACPFFQDRNDGNSMCMDYPPRNPARASTS